MKLGILTALLALIATTSQAREIKNSTATDAQASISRVVSVQNLVKKGELQVNVAVVDLGGSTDYSPTQNVYFSLYRKSEMFSVDATFDLGYVFSFESARRLSGGIYEVVVVKAVDDVHMPVRTKILIDARKAITDMQQVTCEDFDCKAATEFTGTISVK